MTDRNRLSNDMLRCLVASRGVEARRHADLLRHRSPGGHPAQVGRRPRGEGHRHGPGAADRGGGASYEEVAELTRTLASGHKWGWSTERAKPRYNRKEAMSGTTGDADRCQRRAGHRSRRSTREEEG